MTFEWCFPIFSNLPSGILSGLNILSKALGHRMARSGQRFVADEHFLAHAPIFAFGAQLLELVVKIEDKRGMRKAARWAAGLRMEADEEKALLCKPQ